MSIREKIPSKQNIITSKELLKWGYSYYRIKKLVESGELLKLNKSNYENCYFDGEESEFSYVPVYFSTGVVCLMSAAVYYELTNYRPTSIDVAIRGHHRITTLPKRPKLNVYYFKKNRYETGIKTIDNGYDHFKIYDIEKTVVDIIYYRNKIGIEETKEILRNYLSIQNRNLNKLYRYAIELNCINILKTYMEVLI